MNQYQQQAEDFCNKWGVSVSFEYVDRRIAPFADKENAVPVNFYHVCVRVFSPENRIAPRSEIFTFYDSINNTYCAYSRPRKLYMEAIRNGKLKPKRRKETLHPYDILACLVKYDPGTFEEFCSEYGYDKEPLSNYLRVFAIYEAVQKEYRQVLNLFGYSEQCMEELREIS